MFYPILTLRQRVGTVATTGFMFLILLSAADAQLPPDAPSQKRSSRWDRQPHLTDKQVRTDEIIFKKTPQGDLKLHVWSPQHASPNRPCIVFFFGGGWKGGSPQQFARQSAYLASRGMVAISAEYRVKGTHKTTPDVCVEDAKSAIRWTRANSQKLGIDPNKVIAAGGSAGGHLAAATALVPGFDAKNDYPSISAIPDAMVLFNPALDLKLLGRDIADGDGNDITHAISPTHFLNEGAPPAIIFFGTDDDLAKHGIEYIAKAENLGLNVQLWWADNQGHGFFNDSPWLEVTTHRVDVFLASLGYLSGKPVVSLPEGAPSLKRVKGDER